MNSKICEKQEHTYITGLELVCSVLECKMNSEGICKDFKGEQNG